MWWRLKRSQFERQKGEKNRRELKRIVRSGKVPGILGFIDGQPAAWCSIAPREEFSTLERSRVLARIDDRRVWSVVCFFVLRSFRQRGVTVRMLKAAVEYARKRGAEIVEGYPVMPKSGRIPDVFAWTGLASAFRQAGFKEIVRRSATRPIMRYSIR